MDDIIIVSKTHGDLPLKKFKFEFECEGHNPEFKPYYKSIFATSLIEAETRIEKTYNLISFQLVGVYDAGPELEEVKVGDPVLYSYYSTIEKRIVTKALKQHIHIEGSERKFRRSGGDVVGEKFSRVHIRSYDEEVLINYEANKIRKRKRNAIANINFSNAKEEIINAVYAVLEEKGFFKEKE